MNDAPGMSVESNSKAAPGNPLAFQDPLHLLRRRTEGARRPVVDVMLLNKATFDKLRAQSREIDMGGTALRVPKPLHLVALKLHALKQNPKRLGKDWEDIQYLLTHYEWTAEELSELVERYASAESREMLRQAGFL